MRYITITALLTQEHIDFLDQLARQHGIRGRQVPLRWAIDHYRAFLLSENSKSRINQRTEEPYSSD